ncbi:MAG: GNAT family N-acetyltransferase [Ferruginibacter sp.]
MIIVKKISVESIPVIQKLAAAIWPEAYKEILTQAQLEYMLELIYSESALSIQILEKGHQFILASDESDHPVGFAAYSAKEETQKKFHLHKIYVDPTLQGKGIGNILLDFILKDIQGSGATQLELNVNRRNKAIRFYNKKGFKIIREEDIDIGNGYFMNDYIMQLTL